MSLKCIKWGIVRGLFLIGVVLNKLKPDKNGYKRKNIN